MLNKKQNIIKTFDKDQKTVIISLKTIDNIDKQIVSRNNSFVGVVLCWTGLGGKEVIIFLRVKPSLFLYMSI